MNTNKTGQTIEIKAFCRPLADGGFEIWMREDSEEEFTEETPIALVAVDPMPYERRGARLWRIHSLYVPWPWRKQGMGRRLMIAAIGLAERETAEGVRTTVYLDALPYEHDDEPASVSVGVLREFYRTLGFVPVRGHPCSMVRNATAAGC